MRSTGCQHILIWYIYIWYVYHTRNIYLIRTKKQYLVTLALVSSRRKGWSRANLADILGDTYFDFACMHFNGEGFNGKKDSMDGEGLNGW